MLRDFAMAIAFVFIALPWLNPFSPGPTPSVAPLLVSWACAAALLLTRAPLAGAATRLALPGAAAMLFFGASLWRTGLPPGAEVLALGLSLLAIMACALRFAGADQADGRVVAGAWAWGWACGWACTDASTMARASIGARTSAAQRFMADTAEDMRSKVGARR